MRCSTRALVETPPALLREGGVIASGHDAELDELRQISERSDEALLALEERERERSGLPNLRLGYNRVQGYYIEVHRSQADQVPTDWTRRQTIRNAERYVTAELKGFEDRVLGARDRALARERSLYEALLDELVAVLPALQASAAALATLDVLANLAERALALRLGEAAARRGSACIEIRGGRHPVVERYLDAPFVPNDLELHEGRRALVITGPNMGGKSTYMRQNALIVILAGMGQLRSGRGGDDRPRGPHLQPHRRRGRSRRRPLDLHGRDDRGGEHPEQRDARRAWC